MIGMKTNEILLELHSIRSEKQAMNLLLRFVRFDNLKSNGNR